MMEENFFDGDENEFDYEVKLRIEDIHLLHYCVLKRIETWEGSPSRHPQEQAVSYTHLRAHETSLHLVCRLLLEKKK